MNRNANKFDVVVVGGGVAGVCAAIQAARAGARICLVEKTSQLGGTLTNGGIAKPGLFHAWGRQVIAGIGWKLVQQTVDEGGGTMPDFAERGRPHWTYQPDICGPLFAALCDAEVLAAGVDLRLHTVAAALKRIRGNWRITLCGKEGLSEITATIIIDCTGDANAASLAGADVRLPVACQPATLNFTLSGYDPETLDMQRLDAVFREAVAEGRLQAEDAGWNREQPEVSGLLLRRGGNANHIPADASARTSAGRTALELAGRAAVRRLVDWLRSQPGLAELRLVSVSPEIGVRETATVVGLDTVTVEDYVSGRIWPEAVCHAFYPIDLHGLDASRWNQTHLQEGRVPTVPRGALISASRPGLLMAGRILSSDRLANSALRVQATCMSTGQAAGALAALAAVRGEVPASVPMRPLRVLLRRHKAIVPTLSSIKVKNRHQEVKNRHCD